MKTPAHLSTTEALGARLESMTGDRSGPARIERLRIKEILAARYAAGMPHAMGCFCDECNSPDDWPDIDRVGRAR